MKKEEMKNKFSCLVGVNWFTHYAQKFKKYGMDLDVYMNEKWIERGKKADFWIWFNEDCSGLFHITWDVAEAMVLCAYRCLKAKIKKDRESKVIHT